MDSVIELASNAPEWLVLITTIISSSAALAALTPTPKDDAAVGKVLKVLFQAVNILGLNVGKAKNK